MVVTRETLLVSPERRAPTEARAREPCPKYPSLRPRTPAPPQVGNLGGPVLVKPKVQPIVYASDTAASDITAFLKEVSHTSYWSETTAEYGMGLVTN
jgi:hypothetical protein